MLSVKMPQDSKSVMKSDVVLVAVDFLLAQGSYAALLLYRVKGLKIETTAARCDY